jgi:phosphatidylethanolamine/phosphatidyl-N-methylethanolamine N-methyltransferase
LSSDMSREGVAKSYDRLAPIYDYVFGPVFRKGRAESIKMAEQAAGAGGRILEIGVGTGISLPFYSKDTRLVGADISEDMLAVARKRVESLGLTNVESIEVGDAEDLRFEDSSFDVVMAQYVVSACPNPHKALDEFLRVVKPGGEIIVATRQGAERGLRKGIEKTLMPVTTKLGWRTDFPFALFTDWAAGRDDVRLIERRLTPPLGHFALLRFEKLREPVRQAAAA